MLATAFWLLVVAAIIYLGRAASDAFADAVLARRWRRSGSQDPEHLERARKAHHMMNGPRDIRDIDLDDYR